MVVSALGLWFLGCNVGVRTTFVATLGLSGMAVKLFCTVVVMLDDRDGAEGCWR